MKERGLTFCQELVPKVLDGSKFVTRRLGGLKEINSDPGSWVCHGLVDGAWYFVKVRNTRILTKPNDARIKCRQGVAGDRFYMQEAWGLLYPDYKPMNHKADIIGAWRAAVDATANLKFSTSPLIPVYKVDHITANDGPKKVRWRSGRFMPKWACRPQRWELASIRPERLQEITEMDALAEGCPAISGDEDFSQALEWFEDTWDRLNAKRGYPFERNNWVWREEWKPEPVVGECVGA